MGAGLQLLHGPERAWRDLKSRKHMWQCLVLLQQNAFLAHQLPGFRCCFPVAVEYFGGCDRECRHPENVSGQGKAAAQTPLLCLGGR